MQDIHTHLYWKSYDADRDAVVARAREVGVKEIFVIGCTVDESRQAIAIAERYDDMYVAVGIHPQEMNLLTENPKPKLQMPNKAQSPKDQIDKWAEALRVMAKHEKVIAIGECGLEYYSHNQQSTISNKQKEIQKAGFLAQIELAQELGLPMILHCRPSVGTQPACNDSRSDSGRDAYEDLFEILQSKIVNLKSVVLHCYMGDTEVTKKFLTMPNVYFSFTGNITYPVKKSLVGTKDDLTETVRMIPLDRIFTETDCPFLAPQSRRGERNEPSYVKEVLECIAKLHNQEVSVVKRATEENVKKVFPKILS